jgi:hypothetical protein
LSPVHAKTSKDDEEHHKPIWNHGSENVIYLVRGDERQGHEEQEQYNEIAPVLEKVIPQYRVGELWFADIFFYS